MSVVLRSVQLLFLQSTFLSADGRWRVNMPERQTLRLARPHVGTLTVLVELCIKTNWLLCPAGGCFTYLIACVHSDFQLSKERTGSVERGCLPEEIEPRCAAKKGAVNGTTLKKSARMELLFFSSLLTLFLREREREKNIPPCFLNS